MISASFSRARGRERVFLVSGSCVFPLSPFPTPPGDGLL